MRASRILAIIAPVFLVSIVSLLLYSDVLRTRAEWLARISYDLSNYTETPVTLRMLRQRLGSQLKRSEGCTASECGYEVVLSNRVLSALHFAPYTEMKSYFYLRDGVVLENMVDYTTTVHQHHNVVTHVQIDFCKDCDSFSIHPWNDSSLDTNGLVEIGSASSADKKRSVLSLDFHCMTKRGGCTNVGELLPTVWRESPNGKSCVV